VACLPAKFFALELVTVARQSAPSDGSEGGESIGTVAGTYFALAERLHLDWLREQIGALPRDTRWDALARDALRENFFTQHSRLTAEVIRVTDPGEAASERIDNWLRRNAAQARRCEQILAEIQTTSTSDLARLSVAVREIRNLRTTAA
jgi:glutamate dehydrogenase